MRVSFVIPTRNQAPFIRRCIDSCLQQTISDFEIVVTDGLSTDGTQKILESYGERLRFVSEKDSGQAEALNKGVRMASGEIIAWINSDDYYPNAHVLPRVVERFAPDVDIVYGDGLMVDPEGQPLRHCPGYQVTTPQQLLMRARPPVLQPAAFFRRQLFLDVGGLQVDLHYALDYDLWIRMWERARGVRYLADTLAHATYHPDAKTAYGLLAMVNELTQLKIRHGRRLGLRAGQWLRVGAGVASLYTYYAAVRSGLKRAF